MPPIRLRPSNIATILRRAAHSLKGAADLFGGGAAVAAAFKLEEVGRGGMIQPAGSALAALDLELGRLRAALAPYALPDAPADPQE